MARSKTYRTMVLFAPALCALLSARAFGQAPPPPVAATEPTAPPAEATQVTDEVVVRGRRMSEVEFDLQTYVRSFVNEVAVTPAGRGYARWHREVCIGVHNIQESAAQYIADRVSLLAHEVGLEPGEPGCNPDVMIIFTTDGTETAASIVEKYPRLLRPGAGLSGFNLGLDELQEFASTDRAVRWWHVSQPVDARTGQRAVKTSQDTDAPVVTVAGPSRIHSGTRDEMFYVVIVVDATKLRGKTWQQLGDYLALVSLAQVDPQAHLSAFDSILNLFENPLAYSGLTDWDRSFVRALYSFDQERRPELQVNELVSYMVRQENETESETANESTSGD